MKLSLFFLVTLLSFSAMANPYNGVWYFIEGEYTLKDGSVVTADNESMVAIKVVQDDQFTLTNIEKGEFLGFLSGEFAVTKDGYTETIKKGTSEEHVGGSFNFEGQLLRKTVDGVEHEYWHHQGKVNGVEEKEVWRRVKQH